MSLDVSFLALIPPLALFSTLAFACVVVYRLTLHPLAGVPGPLLAAATGWYEVYFQFAVEGGGRYWVEVERLHKIYGPIVRISPWEVHIKDPDWNDIYKLSSKACKPHWYYRSFGATLSTNTTESDHLHRIYRQALTSWFSSQHIATNAPTVQATIDRLHDRLLASNGKPVNLSDAFRCLAIDVATSFAFQRSFGNLDKPDFSKDFSTAIQDYGRTGLLNRYSYGLPFSLIQLLPDSILNRLNPAIGGFQATVTECANYSINKAPPSDEEAQDMVQSMLKSDLTPDQRRFERILAECRSIILGGQETTATVLTSITYHVLTNPDIMAKLRKELKEAQDAKKTRLEFQDIRNLPYLTAVINEALRTSHSVTGRLTRFSQVADLHYKQYFLPRGTNISISIHDTHMDPSIYAEPTKFSPERWFNEADHKKLSKYLQPWGRGARICLGMELAQYDMYLTVLRLFGPDCGFDMKLFQTELKDWDAYGDFFAPIPAPGGKGLQITVEPKAKS